MSQLPKYPHVSLYLIKGRHRITYTLGGRRITERLGIDANKAAKRARVISDLIDSVKSRILSADEARKQIADMRHISIHVEQFRRSLQAGGAKPEHVTKTIFRLNAMLDALSATKLQHVTGPAVERAMVELRTRKVHDRKGRLTDRTLSTQTANYYLRAIKQFTRWAAGKAKVMSSDPLEHVEAAPVKGTGKTRRDITLDELSCLVDWLADKPKRRWDGMDGLERAMLYLVATATGYRANELRQIEVAWLTHEPTPAIRVPGRFTKNGQDALQPITTWLAAMLKAWLGDRTTGGLFPHIPSTALSIVLDRDLRDARAAWIESATTDKERAEREQSTFLQRKSAIGQIDFHSLRHTYVTRLINQGVDVKQVQELARHSTPTLTLERYAHAETKKFAATVERAMPETPMERMRKALRLSGVVSHDLTETDAQSREAAESEKAGKAQKSG